FSEDDSEQRGAVVSFFDTTVARNQSRDLQKSEEQLRFILENQPSVVLMLDLEGIILYINNPTVGYRADEIVGMHSSSFVPPEDRPRFEEYLRRIQVEQEPFSYDIRGYNANGEISWFSTRIGLLEFQEQKRIILISTDVTDRVEAEQRLRTMAYTDLLTGLPNREALYSHLRKVVDSANAEAAAAGDRDHTFEMHVDGAQASLHGVEEIQSARSKPSRYAILFVDLDHFKNINDTLGHDVGDQLLNQVSGRFRNQLSQNAFLARLGGDEFMMVYEVQKDEEATEHARSILGLFRGPLQVDGHDLYLSASIGLCFFPGDGDDIHQLIKNADAAMYKAKARGRNNFCRFEKSMETEIQARLLMDTELRGAATNSELLLHYQPVFDLMSREIVGMEALLRWNNPHLGPVSPAVFIPLAEETGSIRELDLWTMESGLEQLARWREEGLFTGRLALNISARQLENQDFIPRLSGLLQQHGLQGRDISLELTETALMKNITAMTPLLESMREMGIELMIDDFGTGYSSLNYLKRLPVHVVKIDRSFVEEIGTDESDSIVRTIIAMARTLDLKVIAEGVENEEQFQFLRQEGCDLVQGFYLSRPADEASIRSILLRGVV
ncbi:MAG: EAL domain-containing protein, partial [Leptospiraceae bacterium]|nr:EAL domain-containing protein [Leptospiraceae bacterium]